MVQHRDIPHSDEEEWKLYNINPHPFYETNPEWKLIGEEEEDEKQLRLVKFKQDLYTELSNRQLSILILRNKNRGFEEIAHKVGCSRKTVWEDFRSAKETILHLTERYGLSPSEIEF